MPGVDAGTLVLATGAATGAAGGATARYACVAISITDASMASEVCGGAEGCMIGVGVGGCLVSPASFASVASLESLASMACMARLSAASASCCCFS